MVEHVREATAVANVPKPASEPRFTAANSNVWLGSPSAFMVPLSISDPAKEAEMKRIFG